MAFTLILKDLSDFGTVGLQGIHHVLESDRDVEEILYSVERDGFDRAFVYVRGFDDATFDASDLRDLISQLEASGGKLSVNRGPHTEVWQSIQSALTFDQYFRVTNGTSTYKSYFERSLKVSKAKAIQAKAVQGLQYCHAFGW